MHARVKKAGALTAAVLGHALEVSAWVAFGVLATAAVLGVSCG